QRRLKKRGRLRPCVADEDVELPELGVELTKYLSDLIRAHHIGLHEETIRSAFTDLGERLYRRTSILKVVHRDVDATVCQCQSNPSPDSTRAAGDERVLSFACHMDFLRLADLRDKAQPRL